MPFRRLFLSRWSALIWAAGVVWTAYDVADEAAPPSESPAVNSPSPSDDSAAANAIAGILDAR